MITKAEPKKIYPRDTQTFRDWLNTVPRGQYTATVARVIDVCKVNRHKYNNWMSGKTSFTPLEKEKINEVAGIEVFKNEEVKP